MALLHGVAGPIKGNTCEAQMIPGGNDDVWIAAVPSYVRTSFGKVSPLVSAGDDARKEAWTLVELNTRLPQSLSNRDADAADVGIVPAKFSFNVKALRSAAPACRSSRQR